MLYQLKRAGISQLDLVTIYVSVIRPVLESGADPALARGEVVKTFAAAIANVSDHVHAPKTSYRDQHE